MKITTKWLKKKSACPEGITWFSNQREADAVKVMEKVMMQ